MSPASRTSASRVMAVLDALASTDAAIHRDGLTVSEVARAIGRDKSVVSRQLKSLLETGLIVRDDETGRYELSWRLFALAMRAGDKRLTKQAAPVMLRLTEVVREQTSLTVLSDARVLTLHSESPRRPSTGLNRVGRTRPVNRSSSGMALLMDHDEGHIVEIVRGGGDGASEREAREFASQVRLNRRRGFVVADRLFNPEVIGISAPVRDVSGQIKAALNISGPALRIEPHIDVFAGLLVAAVKALQRSLLPDARSAQHDEDGPGSDVIDRARPPGRW